MDEEGIGVYAGGTDVDAGGGNVDAGVLVLTGGTDEGVGDFLGRPTGLFFMVEKLGPLGATHFERFVFAAIAVEHGGKWRNWKQVV